MKRSGDEHSWWLTDDQRQLLVACFATHPAASRRREDWMRRRSIAAVEASSMALVPLLFQKRSDGMFDQPEAGPFKGIYRRTWYENQLALRDLAAVLARLRADGISSLLPADVSLLVASYKDFGLRSLDGLGVQVPPDQAERAAASLLAMGWRPDPAAGSPPALKDRKSIRFSAGTTRFFNLQWNAGDWRCLENGRPEIWSTAVPTSVLGEDTLALSPTEQLLRTRQVGCWHPVPAGRWIADALMVVLREQASLDWSRVIAFSRPSRLSLWFHSRLLYLRDQWGVTIPPDVLETIDRSPRSVVDRVEFSARRAGVALSSDWAVARGLRRLKLWHENAITRQ